MSLFELAHHPCLQGSASSTLPTTWLWKRLKTLCRFEYGDAMPADARTSGTVVVMGSNGPIGHHSVANTVGRTIVVGRKGSFGKVRVSSDPVWVMDTAYFIQERDCGADFDWLAHILCWLPLDEVSKDSAVPGLDRADAMNFLVPVPPASEQAAIVKYLRHAHVRIDRAIDAKRKLIALLDEQKQSATAIALRRFNRDGERELRHALRALVDCEHKTAPYAEQTDYWILRTSAIRQGRIDWNGAYTTDGESFRTWTSRATPEAGDVIFTREAPVGEAAVVPAGKKVALGQRTVLMKMRREVMDADFLVQQIYAGLPRRRIEFATQGSTVGHFNMDDIGWMRVAVPPLSEQRRCVDALSRSSSAAARVTRRARREIALLQEFRTRLTSDVVTGQVDVREVAASLPDLTDDQLVDADEGSNPLDDAEEYLGEALA